MYRLDRLVRKEAIDRGTLSMSSKLNRRMAKIDQNNGDRLRTIVRRHGWPGVPIVAWDGTGAALTVLMHVSAKLQKALRPRVAAAHRAGRIPGSGHPQLVDHVRVNEGRPEFYGTLAKPFRAGHRIEFYPIEIPAQVDASRKTMELVPMATYRKFLRQPTFQPNGAVERFNFGNV